MTASGDNRGPAGVETGRLEGTNRGPSGGPNLEETMKRVSIGDGRWFNADKADKFYEGRDFDGSNHISRATGSQWEHETLYHTAKGKWVLYHWSQWQGSRDSYTVISDQDSYRWLIRNGHHDEVPDEAMEVLET